MGTFPRRVIEMEIVVRRFQAAVTQQLPLGNGQFDYSIRFGQMNASDDTATIIKLKKIVNGIVSRQALTDWLQCRKQLRAN